MWDVGSGARVGRLRAHDSVIYDVRHSGSGARQLLATASSNRVDLYVVGEGR